MICRLSFLFAQFLSNIFDFFPRRSLTAEALGDELTQLMTKLSRRVSSNLECEKQWRILARQLCRFRDLPRSELKRLSDAVDDKAVRMMNEAVQLWRNETSAEGQEAYVTSLEESLRGEDTGNLRSIFRRAVGALSAPRYAKTGHVASSGLEGDTAQETPKDLQFRLRKIVLRCLDQLDLEDPRLKAPLEFLKSLLKKFQQLLEDQRSVGCKRHWLQIGLKCGMPIEIEHQAESKKPKYKLCQHPGVFGVTLCVHIVYHIYHLSDKIDIDIDIGFNGLCRKTKTKPQWLTEIGGMESELATVELADLVLMIRDVGSVRYADLVRMVAWFPLTLSGQVFTVPVFATLLNYLHHLTPSFVVVFGDVNPLKGARRKRLKFCFERKVGDFKVHFRKTVSMLNFGLSYGFVVENALMMRWRSPLKGRLWDKGHLWFRVGLWQAIMSTYIWGFGLGFCFKSIGCFMLLPIERSAVFKATAHWTSRGVSLRGGRKGQHNIQGNVKRLCIKCSPCSHGNVKHYCRECKRCPHGRETKFRCPKCNPCPHGKVKRDCHECSPCLHGNVKRNCEMCNTCPHGNHIYKCGTCKQEKKLDCWNVESVWSVEERHFHTFSVMFCTSGCKKFCDHCNVSISRFHHTLHT